MLLYNTSRRRDIMNNKLIAEIGRNDKRISLLREMVPELKILLKNASTFTREESIEALNKIREKLVLLEDELKNNYCKENNIKLIRIPYYEISKISLEKLDLIKRE